MFSGGGSGTLTRYAVLREDCAGPVTHLDAHSIVQAKLTLHGLDGAHAVWNEPEISPYPLLVTADFIWDFDAGETHFSQHRFTIAAWRYNPAPAFSGWSLMTSHTPTAAAGRSPRTLYVSSCLAVYDWSTGIVFTR